uniref:SdpI family protein n=1 Tax=Neobacillus citreus TaxID=2833578 RepID=A0A942SX80_9BACI
MSSPGWFAAIACAVLFIVVNTAIWGVVSMAVDGVGRNHLAGIRLPSLMRSDEAWKTGHLAARKVMRPLLVAAVVIALVSIPVQLVPVLYIVVLGLSLGCTLAALGFGAFAASRAARRLTPVH